MSDADFIEVEVAEGEGFAAGGNDVIDDEGELKEVVQWLCKEYGEAKGRRAEKEMTWAKWRRQFESRPRVREKNYPYINASNVSPPLSLIVGQALWAHLKSMYDAVDPPWYVEPLREEDEVLVRQAEVVTKYFNLLSKSQLDINLTKFRRDFLQEVAVMGTCYVKVPWTTQPWSFVDEVNGVEQTVDAVLHDGPEFIVVPVEDFVYPENWTDIQRMPWIAHDVPKAAYELQDSASRGIYDEAAVQRVLRYESLSEGERTRTESELLESDIDRRGEYVVTEFYFFKDVNGDGLHEDVVFSVHVPTAEVLRQDYNRFGYRMITAGNFINRTFSIEGRGSGQTSEYQQDEVEGIHNVRNDNMKFSNMRMLAVRRGSFRENESIYPGKMFQVDNPKEDIMPIQLGEVYPSSLQAEQQTMSYAREASGMSSIMSGFSDSTLGTRDTYRGQAMRMNKGMGLFSTIAEGLNEAFSEMGMMLFFQLVRHRDRVMRNEARAMRLSEEEQRVLGEALNVQFREIPQRLAFNIRTSDADETYEAKRQNMLSLTQLFSQYAQQVTPLAMQLFGPQGQQMQQAAPDAYQHMLSIYVGSTKLMSQVFKFFGEEDPKRYMPDSRKFEMVQSMMRAMTSSALEQLERGGQGGQGPPAQSGEGAAAAQNGAQFAEEGLEGPEGPGGGVL